MEKIASFTVDHLRLLPGLYVSRRDQVGSEVVTTFDLRITRPNHEPVMDIPAVHCIEHMGATFLRNDPEWKDRTVYFGPMGCRTGFYVIFAGNYEPEDIRDVVTRMCDWIVAYEGEVPGASPKDCGNYHDIDLPMAKYYIRKYQQEVLADFSKDRTNYPEAPV